MAWTTSSLPSSKVRITISSGSSEAEILCFFAEVSTSRDSRITKKIVIEACAEFSGVVITSTSQPRKCGEATFELSGEDKEIPGAPLDRLWPLGQTWSVPFPLVRTISLKKAPASTR